MQIINVLAASKVLRINRQKVPEDHGENMADMDGRPRAAKWAKQIPSGQKRRRWKFPQNKPGCIIFVWSSTQIWENFHRMSGNFHGKFRLRSSTTETSSILILIGFAVQCKYPFVYPLDIHLCVVVVSIVSTPIPTPLQVQSLSYPNEVKSVQHLKYTSKKAGF